MYPHLERGARFIAPSAFVTIAPDGSSAVDGLGFLSGGSREIGGAGDGLRPMRWS